MRCFCVILLFFFFKQKTAYEMRISDWSSDVCSSDLEEVDGGDVVVLFDLLDVLAQIADRRLVVMQQTMNHVAGVGVELRLLFQPCRLDELGQDRKSVV